MQVFPGTLRYNLTLGLPNLADITDIELQKICGDLNLGDLFDRDASLDLQLNVEDSAMSGGQKQRIGIARAILAKPKILLIDEGTSALDEFTQTVILDVLSKFKDGIAIIFVTHSEVVSKKSENIILLKPNGLS